MVWRFHGYCNLVGECINAYDCWNHITLQTFEILIGLVKRELKLGQIGACTENSIASTSEWNPRQKCCVRFGQLITKLS